jgi:hypothetical protein
MGGRGGRANSGMNSDSGRAENLFRFVPDFPRDGPLGDDLNRPGRSAVPEVPRLECREFRPLELFPGLRNG